jgi:choline dehydrogenase
MTQGLRAARDIGASGALAEWLGKEDRPGPSANSGGDLRAHLRFNLRAYDHFSGTCRMGGDVASVVDRRLSADGHGRAV